MSTEIEETQEYTLDDLVHYWMDDGLPMFLADLDDICDIVEGIGFNIYYLLANEEKTITPPAPSYNKNTTPPAGQTYAPPAPTIKKNSQIYKIVNNFIGRTVSIANPSFADDVISVEESAVYNMPLIPFVLIDKLDQFFRLVDAQHGTESIVMLTYDTNKEGPEGWGILVPDQKNTSTHCNYDPHSIAEVKPDNVMIVGSVHSHPDMSAYASGTDHKDQADFDGLHITFGWQRTVNNGATQYHIEMQMAGAAYTLKPEDVFEGYTLDKIPDPEVVAWTDKVKKVSPPSGGGLPHTAERDKPQAALPGQAVQGYIPHGTDDRTGVSPRTTYKDLRNVPQFDIEPDALIIAEVDFNAIQTVFCPACGGIIDHIDSRNGCCEFCDIPLAQKNDSLANILESLAYYCYLAKISIQVPAYLWCTDETGCHFVIKLTETTIAEELSSTKSYHEDSPLSLVEEDDNSLSNFDNNPFYYENVYISENDILRFEDATKDMYVYDYDSACHQCKYYYTNTCPSYKDLIYQYTVDSSINLSASSRSISDIGCHLFTVDDEIEGNIYYGC